MFLHMSIEIISLKSVLTNPPSLSQHYGTLNSGIGAVISTINDEGCQFVTGRFESVSLHMNKQAGWPTLGQVHL